VWLKHAGYLHQLGNIEDAAISYAVVVASAPQHTEARLKLAEIYITLGRTDDALAILDEGSGIVSLYTVYIWRLKVKHLDGGLYCICIV